MKLLAIDTTGLPASVAITDNDRVLGEFYLHIPKKHAPTLMPLIDGLLKFTETQINDIDAIAVCVGPGSFTGIRIGAACAQGLSYSLEKPIYAVNTLDSLLMNACGAKYVCAVMDARRGEVYAKVTAHGGVVVDSCAVPLTELLEKIGAAHTYMFCGDGVLAYRRQISDALPQSEFLGAQFLLQRASSAAMCAYAGKAVKSGFDGLHINYIRDSGAQRKKQAKSSENIN